MSTTTIVTNESTFSRTAQDVPTTADTLPGRPSSLLEIDENTPDSPAAPAEDESRYPTGRKMLAIFAALAILNISIGLDTSIVAVALPAMSDEFKSLADIVWYATALRLTLCAFLLLFGKAYTLFKVKPLFVGSVITYEVGIVLCTFAPSSKAFIVGRAVTGLGVAGILKMRTTRRRYVCDTYTGVSVEKEAYDGRAAGRGGDGSIFGGTTCWGSFGGWLDVESLLRDQYAAWAIGVGGRVLS